MGDWEEFFEGNPDLFDADGELDLDALDFEEDDEEFEKESLSLRKNMKDFIEKWYGERCPDFCGDCILCAMWKAFDTFTSLE